MSKQRAPSGPVCAGIPATGGLHLAPPGEQLYRGLCSACRAAKAAAK